jgi:hypothetical protein
MDGPLRSVAQVVGKRNCFEGRRQHELVGVQDEGILAFGLDQPRQVGLFHRRVYVRVAVVLEDPEVPVQPNRADSLAPSGLPRYG